MSLSDIRQEYCLKGLDRNDLHPCPIKQFQAWFDEAKSAGVPEPNAMTLATVSRDGTPSARIVLLKGVDERGFTFFTNHEGQKGHELAENPKAALVFFWQGLERQVRISGETSQLSREESEDYFHSRPRGSQIGAWASKQTSVVASRAELEEAWAEVEARHKNEVVPLPSNWGGYVVNPRELEFWQGRPNRLHDRFRYQKSESSNWQIDRLAP